MHTKRVLAVFLVAAMALSVVAMPAAAVSNVSVTATDDGTGATTTHTVSFDDDTDSGDIDEITIDYEASDVSDVAAEDVTVTWGGADQTVASVSAADDTTLTVTLDAAYTLDTGASESVSVDVANVQNPDNSGDYSVGVELYDSAADTTLGPVTGTYSVTVGDTPSLNATASDISDGATVANFNASDTQTETVEVEAHTDNLELRVTDGENVTYTTISDVTTVTSATDSSPGTYQIDLDHSAMENVPVAINETTNVTVEVANNDVDAPVNDFGISLENTDERSVAYVSSDAIDDDSVGVDATTSTVEPGFFASANPFSDAEDETNYEVDTERSINGTDTDVYIVAADGDMQDRLDERAEDADAGDILHETALTHDGHVALIFHEEANTDVVDADSDTYGVYQPSDDRVMINLGDSYNDSSSVNLHLNTVPATDLDDIDTSDVATAYEGTGLGFFDLNGPFDFLDALTIADSGWLDFSIWGDDDDDESFTPLLVVGGAGATGVKRHGVGA